MNTLSADNFGNVLRAGHRDGLSHVTAAATASGLGRVYATNSTIFGDGGGAKPVGRLAVESVQEAL